MGEGVLVLASWQKKQDLNRFLHGFSAKNSKMTKTKIKTKKFFKKIKPYQKKKKKKETLKWILQKIMLLIKKSFWLTKNKYLVSGLSVKPVRNNDITK